jgi:methyl coenzyme M reductase beta subunit
MKNTKTLLALLGGALVSTAAYAQVEVTITGSTAFRSIVIDRCANGIYDAGSLSTYTFDASAGTISYSGTMSNKTSLGPTPVKIHLAFLGSASGTGVPGERP